MTLNIDPGVLAFLRDIWDWAKPILTFGFMGVITWYLKRLTGGQASATIAVQAGVNAAKEAGAAAHEAGTKAAQAATAAAQAIADIKASSDGRDEKLEHIRVLVNSQRAALIAKNEGLEAHNKLLIGQLAAAGLAVPALP